MSEKTIWEQGCAKGRIEERERVMEEIDKMIMDYENGKVVYEVDNILLSELKKRLRVKQHKKQVAKNE